MDGLPTSPASPPPVALIDVPSRLLAGLFSAVVASATPPPRDGVADPSGADVNDQLLPSPTATVRVWVAAAGARKP